MSRRRDSNGYARGLVTIAALLFLALAVPYAWFAVWLLKRIWPRVPPLFAELGATVLPAPTAPSPGEWVLVAAITAALGGLVLSRHCEEFQVGLSICGSQGRNTCGSQLDSGRA